jgi:hypothetical protein
MRRWISSIALMLGVLTIVSMAMPASAQEIQRSVKITRDSKIGGKAIAKGGYEIKFVEGKDGELVLLKGKQEVSKVSYKITKLNQPAVGDAVAYMTADDGSFIVRRIEFKGKSEAITLE